MFDIATRDVNCSTVNVTGIKEMHLIYLFWHLLIILKLIEIYDMASESGHTLIILEVRGRLWCLFSAYDRSARKPRKKKKKSEIAKKKLGRGNFGGSVGAQQTDKILRMA